MIDITGVDLREFIQEVYRLSSSKGMGFLHFVAGRLRDDEVDEILDRYKDDERVALAMDYVKGRCCKMRVKREAGKLTIGDSWYDHTDKILAELLESVGVEFNIEAGEKKHGTACECESCIGAR